MSRTLILVKPDGVQRQLVGEVLGRFERKGLKIQQLKLVALETSVVEEHYAHLGDKPFFGELVSFMVQSPVVAAILEGPHTGIFKVRRTDEFDVTDGVFLPHGDLLLLERRFSYSRGVAMRLRQIAEADLRAGALVDGETLLEANMTSHVDNMEAIDVFRRDDGVLVIALMSDDNQSWFQRNLYLEFELVE